MKLNEKKLLQSLKIFNRFFLRLDKKPDTWEQRLILFVGYLINDNKQSSTVKSYVSTIRAVLGDIGVKLNYEQSLITSLTKACKLVNDEIRTRLPIQKLLLEVILEQTHKHFTQINQPYLRSLFMMLFSTAYFGLFRVGELATGDHPVLARDVHISYNKRKILFVLRTSKTLWKKYETAIN